MQDKINKVKGYRQMLGYTQDEMAEVLNISKSSYFLKESGEREFTLSEAKAFVAEVQKVDKFVTVEHIFF